MIDLVVDPRLGLLDLATLPGRISCTPRSSSWRERLPRRRPGVVVAPKSTTPHLSVVQGDLLLTVAGSVTARELVTIANSKHEYVAESWPSTPAPIGCHRHSAGEKRAMAIAEAELGKLNEAPSRGEAADIVGYVVLSASDGFVLAATIATASGQAKLWAPAPVNPADLGENPDRSWVYTGFPQWKALRAGEPASDGELWASNAAGESFRSSSWTAFGGSEGVPMGDPYLVSYFVGWPAAGSRAVLVPSDLRHDPVLAWRSESAGD